jgi:hypothetical protein
MTPTFLLQLILAFYGNSVPDVQPAFSNYYQDINGGFNGFDNLTRIDGTYQPDRLDEFTFVWLFQGNEYETQDLVFNQVEWSCDGVMEVGLRAIHIETGATFERWQTAFAEWSNTKLYPSPCLEGVCQFCIDPIWTPYTPYQYQTQLAVWDCNGDNLCNTADVICALEDFTGSTGNLQPLPPDPFIDFVPFKVDVCGVWYYNATPEMINLMGSHIGDFIPPLDMTGDGWITMLDVIELLSYQGTFFYSPDTNEIDHVTFDYYGANFPPQVGCTGQPYTTEQFSWTDYGLIGELTTQNPFVNFTFYFAK